MAGVAVSRAFETACSALQTDVIDRGDQILVHGNRLLLHAVFQDPDVRRYKDPTLSEAELTTFVGTATQRAFLAIGKAINAKHGGAYLQPFFKNAQKCRELLAQELDDRQGALFSEEAKDGS